MCYFIYYSVDYSSYSNAHKLATQKIYKLLQLLSMPITNPDNQHIILNEDSEGNRIIDLIFEQNESTMKLIHINFYTTRYDSNDVIAWEEPLNLLFSNPTSYNGNIYDQIRILFDKGSDGGSGNGVVEKFFNLLDSNGEAESKLLTREIDGTLWKYHHFDVSDESSFGLKDFTVNEKTVESEYISDSLKIQYYNSTQPKIFKTFSFEIKFVAQPFKKDDDVNINTENNGDKNSILIDYNAQVIEDFNGSDEGTKEFGDVKKFFNTLITIPDDDDSDLDNPELSISDISQITFDEITLFPNQWNPNVFSLKLRVFPMVNYEPFFNSTTQNFSIDTSGLILNVIGVDSNDTTNEPPSIISLENIQFCLDFDDTGIFQKNNDTSYIVIKSNGSTLSNAIYELQTPLTYLNINDFRKFLTSTMDITATISGEIIIKYDDLTNINRTQKEIVENIELVTTVTTKPLLPNLNLLILIGLSLLINIVLLLSLFIRLIIFKYF